MSGGSYNYFCYRAEEVANEIRTTTPLRRAFVTHLKKVAKAMHDIEWVDSGDNSPGDEDAAILNCLGKSGPALVLAEAIKEAEKAAAELKWAIEQAEKMGGAK